MKTKKHIHRSLADRSSQWLGLCSITFTLLTAGHAMAQNTWTGASATWNLGTNWSTLAIPGTDQALIFNGNPATTSTTNDMVGLTTGSITFSNAGPGAALPANQFSTAFTLGGNPIFLNGNITGNSATQPVAGTLINITDVINLDISLKVTSTINFSNTSSGATGVQHFLTINGLISETGGPFGITKSGSGTLTLGNPSNNFTGPLTATNGTILVGNLAVSGQPSSIGSGSAIFLSGGTINFNGTTAPAVFNRNITLTGSSTLQSSSTAVPFVINGAFNHTGAAKTFNLGGGSTQANDLQSNLVDSSTPGVLTFSKNDIGSWTLSGNNTYTGPTLITNGNLNVSNLSDTGSSNIGLFLGDATNAGLRFGNLGATGTLVYTGSGGSTNRTVQIGTNGPTPANTNTGGGGIKNNGFGALIFSANPFNVQTNATTGVGANRTLTLNGTNTALNEITGAIRDNLISGTATGTATVGVTKTEAGRWILAGANTYTGTTVVSGGTLQINNANALPTGSALTLSGGVIGLGAGDFTRALGTLAGQVNISAINSGFAAYGANRVVNLSSGAALAWGANAGASTPGFFPGSTLVLGSTTATHTVDFQNPIALAGTRFFSAVDGPAAVEGRLSGAITGATTFSKAGTGTLELTNTGNAWTGVTFVDSGTLKLGAAGVILDTSSVVVKRGNTVGDTSGVLDISGFNETIGALTLGESGTTGTNSGQTPSVINSGGAATLTLGGNITYQAGTVGILNGQATISANIATGTAGNRDINVGDGSAADDLVISGAVSGGSVTKLGIGTLVLSGTNTYNGATNVSFGTLRLVGGSQASAVTVATGASLGFTLGSSTTSTAALDLTTGTVKITGTPIVASYLLMTASAITGTPTLDVLIPGYELVKANSDTELRLNSTAPADPYLTWAGPGVNFDADANNDGVQNGLAWLLGATSPTSGVTVPTSTQTAGSLQISFSMLNAASRGTSGIRAQHSSNLGISDPWADSALVPDIAGISPEVNGVTFNVTLSNTPTTNSVIATIANTEAAAGKLFGRLKAEK